MALGNNTRLGPYEILAPIGAGGMGEVYRAKDSKLGREVALKILPEAFSRDADRMARFQREAKVLASLNHTNIASIHGLEDSGKTHALVMELVEGPTLADRIRLRPDSDGRSAANREANRDALEYAHERRDRASGSEAGEREGDERRRSEGSRFRFGEGGRRTMRLRPTSRPRRRSAGWRRRRGYFWGRPLICLRNRRKGRRSIGGRTFGRSDAFCTKC